MRSMVATHVERLLLEHRAYLDGTRYYETAECFLFFSARLLHKVVRDESLHARLAQLLREGCTGDARDRRCGGWSPLGT
jgi:hypothetical protein